MDCTKLLGEINLRSKIFKGAILLTGGQAITQALSFIRNIIIARLLSPTDMGIAATFAITIMLLEMISNLAVDMILIQAKDGDAPVFQGTAHLYQVFRGLSVGLVIFACAPIITFLFKIPQAEWAFCLLALVPVFRGFMHLDWKRMQRKMQYRTAVLVELIPQGIVTLAAFPMVIWLGDYSTVLWLVLMQAAMSLLVSHLFSQRAYRLNWDREYATRLLVFGWPLLINGLLMFGALQGDRLIIGTFYSMKELGVYSVAFSLALTLAAVLTKISTSLFLPLLARLQNQQVEFRDRYTFVVQMLALIGGLVALPFITAGGHLIVLFFGEQYQTSFAFAPWLGVLLGIRIFRLAPTVASLACSDSKNSMYANLLRFVGVLASIFVAWQKMSLSAIIICGIMGEVLALLFVAFRLQALQKIKPLKTLHAPFVVSVVFLLAGLNNFIPVFEDGGGKDFRNCFFFYIILVAVSSFTSPTLRTEFKKTLFGFPVHISGTGND